ncbi:MAG TPA: universal stress protein [Candidatus Bathyarchaeia archaeon]|nr:universal stress protein [Candidatus Bathyarchaeia archaeon]
MYKHILIPTDGSELSGKAIRQGVALARIFGAGVTVLTVSPTFHNLALDPVMVTDTPEQYRKDCEARAEKYLGAARVEAGIAGVPCELEHVVHDHPFQVIVDTAAAKHCDLIVMASHGRRGMAGVLLGSETTKVLTHTKVPVLVCR